ncbi:MAG: sporulation transcription factor Spo0A [Clostridia bacterium]|nr:sporulation transcription factor Spo0A [Clostridia bacterium]
MKNTINVIVADENKETIDEFLQNLPKEKFNVVAVATDGATLLQQIREHNPDVVVMDLVLPQLDGFAVMEKLYKENIKTNIIIHTGLSLNGFVNKAMKLGAKYYAIKPFSAKVLIERIEDIYESADLDIANTSNMNMNKMEEKITNIFITVGIPAHIKGYQFLREAIKLAIANPEIINSITKKLYPTIAEKYSTSASKVERAIRHAIEVAWNRGKIENINNVFGLKVYSSNEKPTNGEFIALVADKMLIEGAC